MSKGKSLTGEAFHWSLPFFQGQAMICLGGFVHIGTIGPPESHGSEEWISLYVTKCAEYKNFKSHIFFGWLYRWNTSAPKLRTGNSHLFCHGNFPRMYRSYSTKGQKHCQAFLKGVKNGKFEIWNCMCGKSRSGRNAKLTKKMRAWQRLPIVHQSCFLGCQLNRGISQM